MAFKFYRESVSSTPESDTDSYIAIKSIDTSIRLLNITWHNPTRLDPMVKELNDILKKYNVYKE